MYFVWERLANEVDPGEAYEMFSFRIRGLQEPFGIIYCRKVGDIRKFKETCRISSFRIYAWIVLCVGKFSWRET